MDTFTNLTVPCIEALVNLMEYIILVKSTAAALNVEMPSLGLDFLGRWLNIPKAASKFKHVGFPLTMTIP